MTLLLEVRRTIKATPQRLFAAWTDPAQLMRWWGPKNMTCTAASVDLGVGGRYRLANTNAEGHTIWIEGEFEEVSPPHALVYSWRIGDGPPERVTVRFEPAPGGTEVIVLHERVVDEVARTRHEQGWLGCLDGLEALVAEG
jgi:uncharacterized protein YndB with AHSA1/START domain